VGKYDAIGCQIAAEIRKTFTLGWKVFTNGTNALGSAA
jgi:hypothetical protein